MLLGEQTDILQPFAQRRDVNRTGRQAFIEADGKPPLLRLDRQIDVRRSHHAHVERPHLAR